MESPWFYIHLLWKTVFYSCILEQKQDIFYPVFNLYTVKWYDNKNIFFKLETVSLTKSTFITVTSGFPVQVWGTVGTHSCGLTPRLGKAAFQRTCFNGVNQDQKDQEEAKGESLEAQWAPGL